MYSISTYSNHFSQPPILIKLVSPCLLPDLVYVASMFCDKSSNVASIKVTLKCFLKSFSGIDNSPPLFSDLLACCRPKDGPGIVINLTTELRWQHFATWTVKFLTKCLTEGTLYVEGLISSSFVSSACTLLCYGDAALQMVGNILTTNSAFSAHF